jgi:hypothetical protein
MTNGETVRRLNQRLAALQAQVAGAALQNDSPLPMESYLDAEGRVLLVESVHPGDPLGREVRGSLMSGTPPRNWSYSCTLLDWASTWRDAEERTAPGDQSGRVS